MEMNRDGTSEHDRTAEPRPAPFEAASARGATVAATVGPPTVDGSMAEKLVEAAALVESVYRSAAEIEQGAESFDNTGTARLYAGLKDRLLAAAGEIAVCCDVLAGEHLRTVRSRHVPKDDVLDRLHSCRSRLESCLDWIAAEEAVTAVVSGPFSIKDLLAQTIARERRVVERLRRAKGGEPADAHGDTREADLLAAEAMSEHSFDEVRAAWRASFAEVAATVAALTEADFDPTGPTVRALGDSIHMVLAYATYGRYGEHINLLDRLRREADRPPRA